MKAVICGCCFILLAASYPFQSNAQKISTPFTATTTSGASNITPVAVDPSISVQEMAVECALAQAAETAGEHRRPLSNPLGTAFKAGLCTGKVQTYMLTAQSDNPSCFPKISMEEGIAIFVKWAAANPNRASDGYIEGLKAAFDDAVPCLRK